MRYLYAALILAFVVAAGCGGPKENPPDGGQGPKQGTDVNPPPKPNEGDTSGVKTGTSEPGKGDTTVPADGKGDKGAKPKGDAPVTGPGVK